MKKTISFLAIIAFAQGVMAKDLTIISFGVDGATNLSSPVASSKIDANKLLDLVGRIHIENDDLELEISNSRFSLAFTDVMSKVLSTTVKGRINNTLLPLNYGNIQFAGLAAKTLFDTLDKVQSVKTSPILMSKIFQNINCSQDTRLKLTTCSLTNVVLVQLPR